MNQSTRPEALDKQVGGDHYAKLKIQPMEFSMVNGWDACAYLILKYVTRHQDKNGRQDLEKALHTVDLRDALCSARWHHLHGTLRAKDYCLVNHIPAEEAAVVMALDQAVWQNGKRAYLELKAAIEHLISVRYPAPTGAELQDRMNEHFLGG